MQTFAADAAVIGVVGPYNSAVGKVQIPISNEAGLLQCSPANTNESLTKPEFGALDYRKSFPDRINYIRVAATDDIQGPAMATYDYNKLGLRNVLDHRRRHDLRQGRRRQLPDASGRSSEAPSPTASGRRPTRPTSTGSSAPPRGKNPDGVYYGGVVTSGAGLLLKQMRQQGLDIPFTGPDGIVNGAGDAEGSLIQIAGKDAAAGCYGSLAAIGDFPGKADFTRPTTSTSGRRPDFKYPGRLQWPGARVRDDHPEVARRVPRDQPGRRPGGHPRGTSRLGDRYLAQLRDRPRAPSRSTRTATPPCRSSRSTGRSGREGRHRRLGVQGAEQLRRRE